MTARRGILASLIALCALALTACGGFPTSGPVEYGYETGTTGDESQNFAFLPNLPQPGASPAEIVEGFINAGTGPGTDANWAIAREFLAPDFRGEWEPGVSVTVDKAADRTYTETAEGTVDFSYDAVAVVDDRGSYERAELAERSSGFTLAQQPDGEWRITDAPDGVVVDQDQFPRVFHRYAVMYFDPTWQFLVPDARWFPTGNAETSITRALVNQPPSEWLAASVRTAFPDGVTALPSVLITDGGIAHVELSEDAAGADAQTLDRMLTQLDASLAGAGVLDVEMTAGTTPLSAEPVVTRSTRLPAAPLVRTEAAFGFLTGDEIEPIPGLSQAVLDSAPAAVAVGPDRDVAAARLSSGQVARLYAEASEIEALDDRAGLVDPSIDPAGNVWSVPRDQPTAVRVYPRSGGPREIADAWTGASAVSAIAVSRDGTRIAATVTASGRTMLWVAGVVRDGDGLPTALSEPVQLAIVGAPATGLTWIDDTTIGVLASDEAGSMVLEQIVGGPSTTTTAPESPSSIAGGNGLSSLRVRAADGTLFVKRGVTWQPTATGILVLATQQGSPR